MKITKSTLKKLIKEELEAVLLEESLGLGQMWTEISAVMQKQGMSLHNPHAWLEDGMSKGYVQRKASRMDTDI